MTTAHPKRSRRLGKVIGEVLLTTAAAGGALCLVLVVVTVFFHVSLIMFKTGSMSPTIPAGSLAVVQQIPAADIRVGDVVTVDRPGRLPITHRVTSVSGSGGGDDGDGGDGGDDGGGGERVVTLKGDANPVADPSPYAVSTVRRVVFALPGLAHPIAALNSPAVLGGLSLGAAAVVTWAFWPPVAPPRGRRRRKRFAVPIAGIAILITGAQVFVPSGPARADDRPQVIVGQYLTLTSIAEPDALAHLTPGRPVVWEVGLQAHPPQPATIQLGISAEGTRPSLDAFDVAVTSCTVPWAAGQCPGISAVLVTKQSVADAVRPAGATGIRHLEWMPSSEQRWLQVQVTVARSGSGGRSATLFVHAWGAGDETVATTSPTVLAETGTNALPAALIGLVAVAIGLALPRIVGRRKWAPGVRT
jgi:signal peptidase